MDQENSKWAFKGHEDRGWQSKATAREKSVWNSSIQTTTTGKHPINIPPNNEFAEELVMNAHLKNLHVGVA